MEAANYRRRKGTDLTLPERKVIEQMHMGGHCAEEIAFNIGVNYVTIYRELHRGETGDADETGRRIYSAMLAQRRAAEARSRKGSKNCEADGRARRQKMRESADG